jgi:hypothetical protein
VPWVQLRPFQHGARPRLHALPLRLVAPGERRRAGHGGGAWPRRAPPHAAGAPRHALRSCPRRAKNRLICMLAFLPIDPYHAPAHACVCVSVSIYIL